MTKIAMFTGSFDPITNGHMDIIVRASKLFDELYIGLFYNKNKPENFCFENDKRYIVRSGLFFFAGLMEILASIAAFFTWILK